MPGSGPFTLGIWRHDTETNGFALYKNGVFVQSCEQARSMGNKTYLAVFNSITVSISRVEWRTTPGGTLLDSVDCDDILTEGWGGQVDEPTAFPPLGSGWRNGATPGTYDAHDGSGFGKIISRAEPANCEYLEVQGITFDADTDTNYWMGIYLHALTGQESAAAYDVATTGGGFGLIYPEPPSYTAEMPFCTGPSIEPVIPSPAAVRFDNLHIPQKFYKTDATRALEKLL